MPRRVEVRRRVRTETLAASDWYADQFAGGGAAFTDDIERMLHDIAAHPTSHTPVRGNVRRTHLRRFPYLVFYRTRPDLIEILLLVHAARDPSVWLEILDAEGWD